MGQIKVHYHGDTNQNTEWGEGRVGGRAEEVERKRAIVERGNIWNKPLPHDVTSTAVKSIELKIEEKCQNLVCCQVTITPFRSPSQPQEVS